MNCWIVIYTHGHGADAWPLFQVSRPLEAKVIKGLDDWEPNKGEAIEIRGPFRPFPLPAPTDEQVGEAYAKGWDSHEGSLLHIMGIRDLECQGIDLIVKDLVKHCQGFKEWRKRYKEGSMEQQEARRRYRVSLKKVQEADHIVSIKKRRP